MEDNVRCNKVKLITLVISSYNIHNNPNKGFNFATGRLDNIAKSTERILEKVEKVQETLADSPQVIALITMSILVLVATVINLLIGIQNLKKAKALKVDNQQNTKKILEKFTEKWTEAEKMIRG